MQSLTWPLDAVNGQLHNPAALTQGITPVPTVYVTFCVPELEWMICRRDPNASAKIRNPDHPAINLVDVQMTLSRFTRYTLVIKLKHEVPKGMPSTAPTYLGKSLSLYCHLFQRVLGPLLLSSC